MWNGISTAYGVLWPDTHGQVEFAGVHRLVEGPGEVVPPQGLDHGLLEELQLVGGAALPAGVLVGWLGGPGGGGMAQRRPPGALEALVEQRRLADALPGRGGGAVVHHGDARHLHPEHGAVGRERHRQTRCTHTVRPAALTPSDPLHTHTVRPAEHTPS